MSNLAKRVIIAGAAGPLILWVSYVGGVPLLVFLILLLGLGLAEFLNMPKPRMPILNQAVFMVLGLLVFLFEAVDVLPFSDYMPFFLFGGFSLIAIIEVIREDVTCSARHTAWGVLGVFYVVFLGLHLYKLRLAIGEKAETPIWIISLFLMVWLNDISAYFAGKYFGKKKVRIHISPNKTFLGCYAGLAGSILIAFIFWLNLPGGFSLFRFLALGLLIGVISQVGDFWESLVKRMVSVKDSSAIIPGHGGILDRFDGVLFAAPALYYFLLFWGN
ncbi:MAG: phosphatidate cytidylyltransferase [bacterium]